MSALDDKPFRIVDYFGYLQLQGKAEESIYINSAASQDVWQVIQDDATAWIGMCEKEIDISGWTKEGLTAFFSSIYTQRPTPYITTYDVNPTQGGVVCQDIIVCTDIPLSDPTNIQRLGALAGFQYTADDWMAVKYLVGSQRCQTINAPGNLVENDSWSAGSGDPTASGTLWLYRFVTMTWPVAPPLDAYVQFPELRFVAEGIATEEPEYVYLTRLRRSYELQQSG
jgi:hypothetical protein